MRVIVLFSVLILWCATGFAQQPVCETALQNVRTDSLIRFVNILTGVQPVSVNGQVQTIDTRYAFFPGNELAAGYLAQTCKTYGFELSLESFSSTGKNVIAYKTGSEYPKKAIILGAHYDCVGFDTPVFHGADDNASGVAAVLEAARVLKDISFPYTLVLAFWDEEEQGLFGSKAFAPSGENDWDVLAVINLDMIGYDGNNDSLAMVHTVPVQQSVPLAEKIVQFNALYHTGLNMTIKNPGNRNTDHQSFWDMRISAVGLTEDYTGDFNPHWHQKSDSLQFFNIPYFTKLSKLAIASLCDLSLTGKFTGVEELSKEQVSVYPNPAGKELTIGLEQTASVVMITLSDMLGKTQKQYLFRDTASVLLDLSDLLPQGVYTLVVSADGRIYRQLIIRQ